MYTSNNTIYASEDKVLRYKTNGAIAGKEHACSVTYWGPSGEKLLSPRFEDESYFEEVDDIEGMIAKCKEALAASDYQLMKFMDGALTEEEYAPIRAERQSLRDRINELEAAI